MARRRRCLLSGVPCHITQRGVDRRETFSSGEDYNTYLDLLRQNLEEADVRILAWCLMTNHLHLIAVPGRADSVSILMRRVQGRYAQYYNAHNRRNGHLWQNRFFACMLAPDHLWAAIAYVERNPVRARIVRRAEEYRWSSAVAHVTGGDGPQLLEMEWWRRAGRRDWREVLNRADAKQTDDHDSIVRLRACTYAERPFGDEVFAAEMAERLSCHWNRGRPSKKSTLKPHERAAQFSLFKAPSS